jgi:hypothetical protein
MLVTLSILVMASKTWIKLDDDCEGAESWQKNKIKLKAYEDLCTI